MNSLGQMQQPLQPWLLLVLIFRAFHNASLEGRRHRTVDNLDVAQRVLGFALLDVVAAMAVLAMLDCAWYVVDAAVGLMVM